MYVGDGGLPSPQEVLLACAAAAPDELRRLLAHLGDAGDGLHDEALIELLSWYVAHQPRRIRTAYRRHFDDDPLPALVVHTDAERELRGDILNSTTSFGLSSPATGAALGPSAASGGEPVATVAPSASPSSTDTVVLSNAAVSVTDSNDSPARAHKPSPEPEPKPEPTSAILRADATPTAAAPPSAALLAASPSPSLPAALGLADPAEAAIRAAAEAAARAAVADLSARHAADRAESDQRFADLQEQARRDRAAFERR
eukprot:SAG11_NODE_2986_length_2789_cov_18.514498_1_plen_257_part_10